MTISQYTDRGFPVVYATGDYEREELHAAIASAAARLAERQSGGFLLDVSESLGVRRRSCGEIYATFQVIAAARRKFGSRVAVVAKTDLAFGLMRMGLSRAFEQGLDGQVFREYEDAMAWLAAAAEVRVQLGQTA
jgi:predicted regulator of Ras-like GTPase activity (Roadblock/LC7/MglB family)